MRNTTFQLPIYYKQIKGGTLYIMNDNENLPLLEKQIMKSMFNNLKHEEKHEERNTDANDDFQLSEKIMKEGKILFAQVKKDSDAVIPSKEKENAGYDIYPCFTDDAIIILPHKTKSIPTGIASAFSADYYVQIEERGSTGTRGMKKSAGVIDSGYRGEWFIPIYNGNDVPLVIAKYPVYDDLNEMNKILGEQICIVYPYDKAIAQAIPHYVPNLIAGTTTYDDLCKYKSERGAGKLGSSGK